jgi:uncharacterized damage-inducible protein DinB
VKKEPCRGASPAWRSLSAGSPPARRHSNGDAFVDFEKLQYPIGRFMAPTFVTSSDRAKWLQSIADEPIRLRAATADLTDEQLDTPYRPQGWTVRQVVHHLADAHLNSYIRTRLALTEDHPTVRTFDEKLWAGLRDARSAPIGMSLDLLDALHKRWAALLRPLSAEQWRRGYFNPESGDILLEIVLAHYSWHGRHHTAHITSLREREGW